MAICSLRLRPVWSLRPSVADAVGQFELDEVMDVFGGGMIADWPGRFSAWLRRWRARLWIWTASSLVRIPAACEARRVGLAGGDFLREQPPVEEDGALPLFEVGDRAARESGRTTSLRVAAVLTL